MKRELQRNIYKQIIKSVIKAVLEKGTKYPKMTQNIYILLKMISLLFLLQTISGCRHNQSNMRREAENEILGIGFLEGCYQCQC